VVSEPDRTQSEEDHAPAGAFRLRSEAPPVMRLSRKVLTGLVGVGAVVVFGALIFALYQSNKRPGGSELYNTETKTTPDGLSNLPRDYTGPAPEIPRLGSPAPGDIGRPVSLPAPEAVDPELQRLAQENEAARTSRLFATTSAREQPATAAPAAPAADQKTAADGKAEGPPLDPGSLLNMQDRKLAFVNGAVDRKTVSPDHLENPVSRYVVQAGSVIAAALITGMRSDLPGQVTAQVTENVYDSPTGHYLLIPQGAKLIGTYDSQVAFGQNRLLLVWTRLLLPNGRSIVLERQPAADPQGFIGLEDEVDSHWDRLIMGAVLSTVIGIGAESGSNANNSAIASALRQGSSNSLSQTGQQITQRNLNIQPTLTIRPGFPVRVIINRDLALTAWKS
jgi:type IV secretory pathway VirB10-like protein